MKHATLRRGFAVILLISLLLSLAAPALAANYVTATRSTSVRASAGNSGKLLGTLQKGTEVEKLGVVGSWTKVSYNGGTGFVLTSNVTSSSGDNSSSNGSTGNTGSSSSTATVKSSTLNVRSGPSTSYSKLGTLSKGATVTVVGSVNEWTIINWNSGTAYVYTSYLSFSSSGSPGTSSGWVAATGGVNVRSGPSTSYSKVGELSRGDKVQKTGVSGSWTQVRFNGSTAYVSSKYLTPTTAPDNSSGNNNNNYGSYVYAISSIPVYASASTSSSALGYLYQGEYAPYLGSTSSFARILFNGQVGYVRSSRVTILDEDNGLTYSYDGWRYAQTTNVPCYSVPEASTKYRLGYLSKGEAVYVLTYDGVWAQVIVEDDFVAYVKWGSLGGKVSGGNNNSSGGNNYIYKLNATLYVNNVFGEPVYSEIAGGTLVKYHACHKVNNVMNNNPYSGIPHQTAVKIVATISAVGGKEYVKVSWRDSGWYVAKADGSASSSTSHTAWVCIDNLVETKPRH
ncbi:SH3 domain-containing protein [Christensenellaceae bacterium OttesenSCG-928-L17]|nr:SH3 domain-containing protein [Christensenellaceae bacterium OttesenSCG-928-L17]